MAATSSRAATDDDTLVDDDTRRFDRLRGGAGNDILISLDGGNDKLNCGAGIDVAFADPFDETGGCETVKSRGRANQLRIERGSNASDFITVGDADHIVFGRNGDDFIRARDGDDWVLGGLGSDAMSGENDEDTIIDDDSSGNDSVRPGDDDDVMFVADGARTSVDCSDTEDDGDDDVVYADPIDAVIDCGTVFSGP